MSQEDGPLPALREVGELLAYLKEPGRPGLQGA